MDYCRIIKKIFAIVLVGLMMTSCGLFRKTQKTPTQTEPYDIIYARTMEITTAQLDSICVADTLIADLNEWYSSFFVDDETGKTIIKYIYIKQNSTLRTFYILTIYEDKKKFKMVIRTEKDND